MLRSGAPEEEGVKTLGGGERLLRLPVIGVWPGLPGHGVLEVRWQLLWSLRGLWLAAAEGTLFLVARKGRGGGSEVGRRRWEAWCEGRGRRWTWCEEGEEGGVLLLSQEEAIGCKQWMRRVLPMEEVCGRKAMVTGYKGTERKVKGFSTLFSMSRRRREGVTHPLCSDVIMASAVLGDRASDCSSFLLNLGGFEIKSFITKTRGHVGDGNQPIPCWA